MHSDDLHYSEVPKWHHKACHDVAKLWKSQGRVQDSEALTKFPRYGDLWDHLIIKLENYISPSSTTRKSLQVPGEYANDV
jgi:hypothetical protein